MSRAPDRLERLVKENEQLYREVERLRNKNQALEQQVAALRILRTDYREKK